MKKIILLIVLLIPIKVVAISAESYIVMDADAKRVIEGKNINDKKLIASTTKIMTALVTIENANLNDKVTVDQRVLKAYGSAIYIEIGEVISIKDLLYGLMLRSGNDAAIVLKNYFEDKNIDMIKLMNDKAKKLKMENTNFVNPHGLEENDGLANVSTAYDMALLMSNAMNNKTFKKIVSTKEYIGHSNKKKYTWKNKNKLLSSYEYCTGGKTGFTKKAKRTLVTSAEKDGKKVVVVTLNDGNDFNDHKTLYEKVFKNYEKLNVMSKQKFKIYNESYYKKVKFYVKHNYSILVNEEERNKVYLNIVLEKNPRFKNNQKIGKVQVMLDDKVLYEQNIYIKKRRLFKW